jgi:hypothetical protein
MHGVRRQARLAALPAARADRPRHPGAGVDRDAARRRDPRRVRTRVARRRRRAVRALRVAARRVWRALASADVRGAVAPGHRDVPPRRHPAPGLQPARDRQHRPARRGAVRTADDARAVHRHRRARQRRHAAGRLARGRHRRVRRRDGADRRGGRLGPARRDRPRSGDARRDADVDRLHVPVRLVRRRGPLGAPVRGDRGRGVRIPGQARGLDAAGAGRGARRRRHRRPGRHGRRGRDHLRAHAGAARAELRGRRRLTGYRR